MDFGPGAADRRYAARRASILEAQDAALELRDVLSAYGPGTEPQRADGRGARPSSTTSVAVSGRDPELEARKRAATGRFQVTVSRVHDASIVSALANWRSAAERRFVSVAKTPAGVEDEWFTHVQDLCRLALTSADGSVPAKGRDRLTAPVPLAGE